MSKSKNKEGAAAGADKAIRPFMALVLMFVAAFAKKVLPVPAGPTPKIRSRFSSRSAST